MFDELNSGVLLQSNLYVYIFTVAKRAASKTHSIDGHELDVSLYVPPPYDDKKILVRGIAEQTSKDSLMNFLEAKSTIKPISVSYHAELMDVALVTMEHKPGLFKLIFSVHSF